MALLSHVDSPQDLVVLDDVGRRVEMARLHQVLVPERNCFCLLLCPLPHLTRLLVLDLVQ